ncbi:MAG: hypothetical protein ACLFVU_11085 [Phycisphaerae bacterium]
MQSIGKLAAGAILVSLVTLVGCDKKYNLTFVNHTDQSMEVKVTPPMGSTQTIGQIGADGSQLNYSIKVNTDDMPATTSVKAGMMSRSFTITEDTPGKLWFHIDDKGIQGPLDKKTPYVNTSVKNRITLPAGSRTVVE